jgi:magnesium-transporting ATPase (P-type)
MTPELKAQVNTAIEELANSALRTIVIAYKPLNGDEDLESKNKLDV